MVELAGKYSFVSQENFEAYLKAAGQYKSGAVFINDLKV